MQLAAKIRRDLLVVDGFWKKFLQKHGNTANADAKQAANVDRAVLETQSSFATPVDSIFSRAKVVIERLPAAATPLPIEEVKVESYEVTTYDNDYNDYDDYDDENDGSALEEDRLELETYEEDESRTSTKQTANPNNSNGVMPIKGELKHFKCSQIKCEAGKMENRSIYTMNRCRQYLKF